jgi:arylsulfatase A-like enzyme
LVSLVDIAPTLAEAAGTHLRESPDGRCLQPLLDSGDVSWRDELLVAAGGVNALLTDRWKYMRWQDGFEELYDRRTDSHDLYNLARRAETSAACGELAGRLAAMQQRLAVS